jgi:hypothetical protein
LVFVRFDVFARICLHEILDALGLPIPFPDLLVGKASCLP